MASWSATTGRGTSRRGGKGPARKPRSTPRRRSASRAPARRPAARRRSRPSGAFGKAVRGGWNLLAKGLGSLARTVGRSRALGAEHRRDGLALGLIAVALIAAVGVWWRAAGAAGAGGGVAPRPRPRAAARPARA